MPSDPVEQTKQVKAASDIVAVVGSYIPLHAAGKTFKAVCPFHNDTRPSLDVDPQRQRYKCWSCGAHGDVFSFVMHQEKVGFKEARAILAAKAGIKLDEQQSPQDHHRARLLEVMKWAQAKYAYQLLEDDTGAEARKYLGERKLAGKTIRDFGLGFAPIVGDWLVRLAAAERIPAEVLVEVGLIAARDGGRGYYDRFRDRVMFPIRDVRGQVVGFGGRIMPNNPLAARGPKYYNSAETTLFHKSDLLYGLDLARHGAAAAGYLAVVEGYTDVMMAHQCGVPQVVATMGTALNAKHVAQLRRYVPKVVLVYDADAGGFSGVDRALEIFVSQDVELAVATLPDGLDPCDLLLKPDGVEIFKKVLTSAVDALDFKLNKLLERDQPPSDAEKQRIADDILGIMAAAPLIPGAAAQMKRELIVTRLVRRLGIKDKDDNEKMLWKRYNELRKAHEQRESERLQKEREQGRDAKPSGFAPARPTDAVGAASTERRPDGSRGKSDPHHFLATTLVRLLVAEPELVPVAAAEIKPEDIGHTGVRRLVGEMYAVWERGQVPDIEVMRARLEDRPDLFDALVREADVGRDLEDRPKKLQDVIANFRRMKAEAASKEVKAALREALTPEQQVEALRKLQQTQPPKPNNSNSAA
ncbi:MAG: DNA primase [Planctomycetes bacterium]|nr:DNA primase [Planctomycetota bacterium]